MKSQKDKAQQPCVVPLRVDFLLPQQELFLLVDLAVNVFAWPGSRTSTKKEVKAAARHAIARLTWREMDAHSEGKRR